PCCSPSLAVQWVGRFFSYGLAMFRARVPPNMRQSDRGALRSGALGPSVDLSAAWAKITAKIVATNAKGDHRPMRQQQFIRFVPRLRAILRSGPSRRRLLADRVQLVLRHHVQDTVESHRRGTDLAVHFHLAKRLLFFAVFE